MADRYINIVGFVQFDPREREVGDRKVRDIVVRSSGSSGVNISATLWPDFKDVAVKKGDLVAIEGKYTKVDKDSEDGPKTYHNMSVQRIVVTEAIEAPKPDTVNQSASASEDEPF